MLFLCKCGANKKERNHCERKNLFHDRGFLFGSQRKYSYSTSVASHTSTSGFLFNFFEPRRHKDAKDHEVYFTTLNLMSCVLLDDVPTIIVKSPGSTIHFMSLS